jgi:hypothetical protein
MIGMAPLYYTYRLNEVMGLTLFDFSDSLLKYRFGIARVSFPGACYVALNIARFTRQQAFTADTIQWSDLECERSEKFLIYPVRAEVYVNKLLDRNEFRTLRDRKKTQSAILIIAVIWVSGSRNFALNIIDEHYSL